MLLQGAARLEIGDELIELATGDCVTFDQRSPRRVTALGPRIARRARGRLPARDLTASRRLAATCVRLRRVRSCVIPSVFQRG